jgi:hypothetical protein
MIEKIDIKTLGESITEYRDGVPFTSIIDPMKAAQELAEKLNEVIEVINTHRIE